MTKRQRIAYYFIVIALLIFCARYATGSFQFVTDFWFVSGFFLVFLLAFIDQPHFSTDSNVLTNASTGFVSLLTVVPSLRDSFWTFFVIWTIYLLISSATILWIRSTPLKDEHEAVQLIARLNRVIGNPKTLFSALFFWGLWLQFNTKPQQFVAFLAFWAIFFILDIPQIINTVSLYIMSKTESGSYFECQVTLLHPQILRFTMQKTGVSQIGSLARVKKGAQLLVEGTVIDDRILAGIRVGEIALHSSGSWTDPTITTVMIEFQSEASIDQTAISYVADGTSIPTLICFPNPTFQLRNGQILWAKLDGETKIFYQITDAQLVENSHENGNAKHQVKTISTQLGFWNEKQVRFEPADWLPKPGSLVHVSRPDRNYRSRIPKSNIHLGQVPNSNFPIHVDGQDIVTQNSAIIGVTGSGKSYLAMHLTKALVEQNIKILILDITRQHFIFLKDLEPTAIKQQADIKKWLKSDSNIGIHQFANSYSYPQDTADLAEEAYTNIAQSVQLKPGTNEPARLLIIFEEAHSLIPEWNQVARRDDSQHVNRTGSCILQGRKYGMGSLVITQRTANVTKTILNQCNTVFALRSYDQTGLDFLKNYMGEDYSKSISTLPNQHAILVGKASSSARPVHFEIKKLKQ